MPKYSTQVGGAVRGVVQGHNATINITNGTVEIPCEAFIAGCTATAVHTVKGYRLCTRCAQAFAGYTPEIDTSLV